MEKAEEYLDKLEGAIELEEEGGDVMNTTTSYSALQQHTRPLTLTRQRGFLQEIPLVNIH